MNPSLFLLLPATFCTAMVCSGQVIIDRYLTDPLTYTTIVTSADQVSQPRDLDFKPNSNELWVMNRGGSNGGSMVIVHNAGMTGQTDVYKKDTHSSHFMTQASAMAFSPNGEWAAVSEVQNTSSPTSTFMGPGLWSGDPNIFATVFQNNWVSGLPLGSHLDMLHQSPFAMGIAADSLKVYWVMDGHFGNICRYDFVQDHGPGYDDHGAGKIWRYIDVPVSRVANIPSHMVLDKENGWLYFIDGGTKQIKRLDVNSGTITGNLSVPSTSNEPLASYKKVEGATVEVVDTWTTQPCGIDYVQDRLVVSDHTTGEIRIYDVSGSPALLGTIATGMTTIMGVKVGPDGRIWFTHYSGNKVVRIDPLPLANDAAIAAIVTPATVSARPSFYSTGNDVCAGSIAPVVTLANMGSNTLTNVDIHFHLDAGSATMYAWSGSLAPGATSNVTLPSTPISNGAHQLNVWTEMPNGTNDANTLNDQLQGSFRAIDPIQSLPFNEGFSTAAFPPVGWNYVHFNPNNQMTRNASVGGFGLSTGCVKMDHYSGAMDITGQLDYLMLPRLDLSTAPVGTTLDFGVADPQDNTASTEHLMVSASTDCGTIWSTLYDEEGASLSTTTPGTGAFTPSAAQWRTDYVDLSAVIGQPEVIFMFVTDSDFGNNMYLDDVRVANTVGIAEAHGIRFEMFPNPASDHVDVAIGSHQGPVRMELYNALGGLVLEHTPLLSGNAMVRLDLGGVANGAYTLLLRTTDTIGVGTLVVANH